MDDALELSAVEGLSGGPLLSAVDVRRSRLAVADKDSEVGFVIALLEFVLHELYQLIPETEEDVKRKGDDAIVQKGENRCVHHALEAATGSVRPLRGSFLCWRREVEGVQQRGVPN